jgi:hypothetical protein
MKPATSDVTVMMNKLMAKLDAIAPKIGVKHLGVKVLDQSPSTSRVELSMEFSPEITDAKTRAWAVEQLRSILENFEAENDVRVGQISVEVMPDGTAYAVPKCDFWNAG